MSHTEERPREGVRLSPRQAHLWPLHLSPGPCPYRAEVAVRIDGPLDHALLRRALERIVQRYEVLRTTFRRPPGESLPLQHFSDGSLGWKMESDRTSAARYRSARFDLGRGPLLRGTLVPTGENRHHLYLTASSLCADGRTLELLVRDAAFGYDALRHGERGPGEPGGEPVQYADYAAWHWELLEEEGGETERDYWNGIPSAGPSAGDPPATPFAPRRHEVSEGVDLGQRLARLASQLGAPSAAVLLACWQLLLRRTSGLSRVCVGAANDGRTYEELRDAPGLFATYLPVTIHTLSEASFAQMVADADRALREGAEHQEYLDGGTRFRHCFSYVDRPDPVRAGELLFSIEEQQAYVDRFELELYCVRAGSSLRLELRHDAGLSSPPPVERVAARFRTLLDDALRRPHARAAELEVVCEEDRAELSAKLDRCGDAVAGETFLELFHRRVDDRPDAVAVLTGENHLTYAGLEARANRLACNLVRSGVEPETVVGVACAPSIEMVVAVLAVWKAGGAFVPVDREEPERRLLSVLERAGVVHLVAAGEVSAALTRGRTVIDLGQDPGPVAGESAGRLPGPTLRTHLAYVLPTSGSTGEPKGVMIDHAGLANYLRWCETFYDVAGHGAALMHSPLSFDFTLTSLLAPLITGASVVIPPRAPGSRYFAGLLAALREGRGGGLLKLTPSHLSLLGSTLSPAELRAAAGELIVGGEALHAGALARWFSAAPEVPITNEYGPTEATVGCCVHRVRPESCGEAVPIGFPISGVRLSLLDELGLLVPPGAPGELYVSGACLARGYFGRPDLTAERFVPAPFGGEPGARAYRTGDLASFDAEQGLTFLGRVDRQIKLHGHRIEPGEVEAALRRHPSISEAAVTVRRHASGHDLLTAWVVARPDAEASAPDSSQLRSFLAAELPEPMIPARCVQVEAMPLTSRGKIDWAALPAPDAPIRAGGDRPYVAPATPQEEILAAVWARVLGVEAVSVDDNYFALGGDSIRSIQVVALARERGIVASIDQLFRHPTVRSLAASLSEGPAAPSRVVPPFALLSPADHGRMPEDVEDAYPLSRLQGGMLFHRDSVPGSSVYHDIWSLHLRAPLDVTLLRTVIEKLIDRHPVLRTSFDLMGFGEPLQLVHRAAAAPLEVHDLSSFPPEQQATRVEQWVADDLKRGFDPTAYPLVRFCLHVRGERSFQLSGSFHHAILDGWSDATMVTEILGHYLSLMEGEPGEPTPPASHLRDFIALERAALDSEEQARYWQSVLTDFTPLRLPRKARPVADGPRSREVKQVEVPVGGPLSADLQRRALALLVPLKSLLLAAHLKVLGTVSGESDVSTCVVSSGRLEDRDGERTLGLFLNSLPFRLDLGHSTLGELALRCFDREREALEFRRYPMAELKRQRGEELAESLFYFTNYHIYRGLERWDAELVDARFYESSSFPLVANFRLDPFDRTLRCDLQYDRTRLDDEVIERMTGYYRRALQEMARDPDAPQATVSLLGDRERACLRAWGGAPDPVDDSPPTAAMLEASGAHDLFHAQAGRTPDAIALIVGNERCSYRSLQRRANRLAHHLVHAGIGPETRVGLCLPRGAGMVLAALAVWEAGGAWVALDPRYPDERLDFMRADSDLSCSITVAEHSGRFGSRVVCLDRDREAIRRSPAERTGLPVHPRNLAYVIYTSGSTGTPKGVAIEHRSLVSLLEWARRAYSAGELGGVLCSTSICFDLSLFEIFAPLAAGGTVIVAEDALALDSLPARHEVRLVNTVPSAMEEVVRGGTIPPGVRTVNLAGEPLRAGLVDRLYQLGVERVCDLYGPSEDTTYSTFARRVPGGPETIGKPVDGTSVRVLDGAGLEAPIGVQGELVLSGAGLARGYLGRPEATAERFRPDRFSTLPGARSYATGDLGHWSPEGDLRFLGRNDHQVKLRGFRIELGEVEAALAGHPDVAEVAAVVRGTEAARRQLVACIVPAPGRSPSLAPLRTWLLRKLPQYVVPSDVVVLAELPRTPNGKLDRRALTDLVALPGAAPRRPGDADERPRDELEAAVASAWAEALDRSELGRHQAFVDLGGHSLLALRVARRLERQVGVRLNPADVLVQTIAQIAATCRERLAPDRDPGRDEGRPPGRLHTGRGSDLPEDAG